MICECGYNNRFSPESVNCCYCGKFLPEINVKSVAYLEKFSIENRNNLFNDDSMKICPDCNGIGMTETYDIEEQCTYCDGLGFVPTNTPN